MNAVFRHELRTYRNGVTGYVFGAFLLLFAGIYTMVYNLKSALATFEFVPSGMCFVFLIAVPILTMRVLAEEKRQRTDQLLYSLPLSMTQVVLGKYCAMLVVLLIPILIMSLFPLLLCRFGAVNLAGAYGSLCGFLFLGAALLAIGTFVSSVTENQATAAGLCFVVMLLNYFLSSLCSVVSSAAGASLAAFTVCVILLAVVVRLMTRSGFAAVVLALVLEAALVALYLCFGSSFEGLFPEIVRQLSLYERFYTFVDGVFDITGLVYFLTVIGVFLFLSVQSMEKRRWSE